jgi:hypothetical protein
LHGESSGKAVDVLCLEGLLWWGKTNSGTMSKYKITCKESLLLQSQKLCACKVSARIVLNCSEIRPEVQKMKFISESIAISVTGFR